MLSATHRLRRSKEFEAAVRRGVRAGRKTLVVHLLLTESADPPRCGFVASKAVGSAPTRNTVKRRLRHLMRDKMRQLPAGSLLVVRALPPAARMPAGVLGDDLDAVLSRVLTRAGVGGAS